MRTVPFDLAQKLASICFDDYTQNAYATKAGIEYSPLLTNSVLTTKIGSLIYNYEYCNIDDKYYESANYYSSDFVAENNARADKLMRQLRRFAVQHRKPGINFNNANTEKYYIICDYENDELRATYTSYAKVFGVIYFDSREVANAAIDKFHDELIWYFNEYKDSL